MGAGTWSVYACIAVLCALSGVAQSLPTGAMAKTSYQPGETVQIEVQVPNLPEPITTADIMLLDPQQNKISIAPFLWKEGSDHYMVAFDLPLTMQPGNYTVYLKNNQQAIAANITYPLQQSFEVLDQSLPILSLQPAFIFQQDNEQEFTLTLSSKRTTTTIQVTTSAGITHVYTAQEIVQEGTTRTFKFSLQPAAASRETITISYANSTYIVPVFKKVNDVPIIIPPTQQPRESRVLEFRTAIKIVNRTIAPEQRTGGILSFQNSGNETMQNVTIGITGNLPEVVMINQTKIPLLEPAQVADVYVVVNDRSNAKEGLYSGEITVMSGVHHISLPMYILVQSSSLDPSQAQNLTIWTQPEPEPSKIKEFNISIPSDGKPAKKKKQFEGIGSLLFVIFFLLIAAVFFFIKNKKTVEKRTFQEYLKERREKP